MRVRRLYSNEDTVFEPIVFNRGLSAVVAEIRRPSNRMLDTHNLGKSTVGQLLDYCLLKGKNRNFFLFREDVFADFSFFLELELSSGQFLTIGRPVSPGTRVWIKRSRTSIERIDLMEDPAWDHEAVAFETAKALFNGIVDIQSLKPYPFRKLVGYLIRSQRDYLDVFQLGKFSGKHQDWKPFVALLLGLDGPMVRSLYDKREELATAEGHLRAVLTEWGSEAQDSSTLDGLIAVKRRNLEAKAAVLQSFNFREEDARVATSLVEGIDSEITSLNEEAYGLLQLERRLAQSLVGEQILFRPDRAERLFREADVELGTQVKRSFNQLLAFNRAITAERHELLKTQLDEVRERLGQVRIELAQLNRRRAEQLAFLRGSDALAKFVDLSNEVSELRAELVLLDGRREAASRVAELRRETRALQEEHGQLVSSVESAIESVSKNEDSRFARLRQFFGEIIFDVLGQNAILALHMNQQGGLEFTAEFVGDGGTATSGDRGTSYKKLMCVAFDLAMLRTFLDQPFPRFVYHDGALEQLEPRKRDKLLQVFREYAALGLQPVISVLDSELPAPVGSSHTTLSEAEVVVTLHDEGADGRLFKMPSW